jgi:uncharacterized protein YdcH (DUF465 family)
MEISNLKKLKAELKRFETRLNEAIVRLEKDEYAQYGCKETGALKRSSIDLKNEMTKQLK